MAKRDFYEILGVGKSASADEIKSWNPDEFKFEILNKISTKCEGGIN